MRRDGRTWRKMSCTFSTESPKPRPNLGTVFTMETGSWGKEGGKELGIRHEAWVLFCLTWIQSIWKGVCTTEKRLFTKEIGRSQDLSGMSSQGEKESPSERAGSSERGNIKRFLFEPSMSSDYSLNFSHVQCRHDRRIHGWDGGQGLRRTKQTAQHPH